MFGITKKMAKIVSHTQVEIDHLDEVQRAGNWVDVTRKDIPAGKLYSWWSYRAKDWNSADRGRRLDHIWASADIASHIGGSRILREARSWERPSDHVPVFATINL
jgi:exodeoxyribonuclease-3